MLIDYQPLINELLDARSDTLQVASNMANYPSYRDGFNGAIKKLTQILATDKAMNTYLYNTVVQSVIMDFETKALHLKERIAVIQR